ncbi:hypothetical protein VSX64_20645 [Aurantimonas sp. C2-6-R+9]|nr:MULTISPECIES: hypothetical protein [unclassified Aurantimonas]MEC5292964.1 hypothetical protein [Aurantimonas sp. C2-3-R2]MEC5383227.1 hypothetical protein [Aurantimonas sp. C2-6-R+9]MEC5413989.1 hypothetical protein [Aurantimonas sp. C2-4-R8]
MHIEPMTELLERKRRERSTLEVCGADPRGIAFGIFMREGFMPLWF